MKLSDAQLIAEKYLQQLKPFCKRIEIAGSIRRKKPEVKDIEFVCIPLSTTLFEDFLFEEKKEIRNQQFVQLVNSFTRTKGNGEGKYTNIILLEDIRLDLFITTPEQWGIIFMIRTGSAEYSKRMVTEIKQLGYYVKDGFLWCSEDRMIPCWEEKDFYEITGMPFYEPTKRIQ